MDNSGVGGRHRIRMLIPLWGATYYERWLSLAAPALMAPGNIAYLHAHADFELVFLCKSQDLEFLQSNATIRQLSAQIRLKMITIDEFFPRTAVSYGMPLTLAYAKGIQDLGEEGLGTFVILLNADFLLSEGSLAQLLRRLNDGNHIVTAPSLRVVEHEVRPVLEGRLQNYAGVGCFAARPMMAIAERHLHQTVRARIINIDRPVGAWHYHLVYWRISPTCLAGRSFLLMPLCFQIRRQPRSVICPVDYGFIQEYCPGGRYATIGDSDEMLMVELQARDSEAELLQPAPSIASAEAMEYRIATIAGNAAEWTTAEHRRAFAQPLLFHSEDPPAGTVEELAKFDRVVARVIERMPPPASAVRHYHWLGAVRAYTSLSNDGIPFEPQLLRDKVNRLHITLFEITPALAAHSLPEYPAWGSEAGLPENLAKAIREASICVALDGLVHEVWRINPDIRIFPAEVAELHVGAATVELAPGSVASGSTVAIYLLTDSLSHWPNVKKMCDEILTEGGRVTLVFRDRMWTSFDPQQPARCWMLSRFEAFFGDGYVAAIEPIPAVPQPASTTPAWRSTESARMLCHGHIVALTGKVETPVPWRITAQSDMVGEDRA